LRLHATDTNISIGESAYVEGPAVPLLLAATGRCIGLPDGKQRIAIAYLFARRAAE
jgi:hypothetical protein